MKIYTKTGDDGTTGLFGNIRVSKGSDRIWAIGTLDEANAFLGICTETSQTIRIQEMLFNAGADLSAPNGDESYIKRIGNQDIEYLENEIDRYDEKLPPLKNFILPNNHLHVARTIVRRAERLVSELEHINPNVAVFLNRLSDLLFVMARFENINSGISEREWRQ
jgi:cob(I)alamin adenosyltransferase